MLAAASSCRTDWGVTLALAGLISKGARKESYLPLTKKGLFDMSLKRAEKVAGRGAGRALAIAAGGGNRRGAKWVS